MRNYLHSLAPSDLTVNESLELQPLAEPIAAISPDPEFEQWLEQRRREDHIRGLLAESEKEAA